MKLMHLADLHLGKILLEQSFLEDQKYMLNEIIEIAISKNVDAVLISGDVYDKGIPTTEAVDLLNDFLNILVKKHNIKVFIISGNHDSKSRLNFGSKIFEEEGLYIETNYRGKLKKVELGNVNIYMLPFIKPVQVKEYFEEEIKDYNDAIRLILEKEKLDKSKVNILMAHQFVTYNGEKPEVCESEVINVGSLDNIDAKLFFDFDYVALGHIHGPQKIGKDTIRYSGTMLKYSFSEVNHKKSLVIIDTDKVPLSYELVPLKPLRDLRVIRGSIEELLNIEDEAKQNLDDYIRVILTDEDPGYSPFARMRTLYPNALKLDIDNSRTAYNSKEIGRIEKIKEKGELDLFKEFYKYQNNVEMTEEECKAIKDIIDTLDSFNEENKTGGKTLEEINETEEVSNKIEGADKADFDALLRKKYDEFLDKKENKNAEQEVKIEDNSLENDLFSMLM